MRVKATREGLIGHETESGYVIDVHVPFVALPARAAIRRAVRVSNPANGRNVDALVLDVGPWNLDDTAYVLDGARPQAESGRDVTDRVTNGAGIDLGWYVWHALGMVDNTDVDWYFL